MKSVVTAAIAGFLKLILAMGLFLFLPAWSLKYWQGWLYLAVFCGSAAAITVYLWKKDPALLERRVKAGPGAEKERSQKIIQALANLFFVIAIALPAVDHRMGWSKVPPTVVLTGDLLVALGFLLIFLVFRENSFTAATIEVAAGQRVISTGPYSLIRHPMYAGALIMLSGTPLALGSWWGLLALVPMTCVIVWRLGNEERFLSENLVGYKEYRKEVRFRLVPFIW